MKQKKEIRVLVVEDDPMVSQMIRMMLEKMGYTVAGRAADGLTAIEMVQSLKPDIIFMDIEMPGISGIDTTRRIYETYPTPVIMLTAYETHELVEWASGVGAGAYLVKPPQAQEMERAITIALARFDDMMELRRLNTRLKTQNEELLRLTDELQERNEDLDTFTQTVAHDVKSQLGLMTAYAEIVADEIESEKLKNYLSTIIQSGRKLANIVEELHLLLGVRKMDVVPEPLDMVKIMSEVKLRLSYLLEQTQAQILFPDEWPLASGYAPWIEEVWVNYLSNAVRYGGQPPMVQLGATALADGMVHFWVQDNGHGISQEMQAQLFTPLINLAQIRAEGAGLGLSIVRRIVQKLGGQVKVKSKLGQGSTFFFTLPKGE